MRRLTWVAMLPALLIAGPGAAEDRPPIVAVFNVEAVGLQLPTGTIESLSTLLTGWIAASGSYQVVPRDILKERLVEAKKSTYKDCYAQSCQIELGQELAAQKTIATQIVKVGSSCTVTLNVFDLLRAASESGASAEGGCSEDGIFRSLRKAVSRLASGDTATARSERPASLADSERTPAAPEIEEVGPRVKGGIVTTPVGDLTVQGKTPAGTSVRLEITDPDGEMHASGSPFKDPQARVGTWKVVARATGHETQERRIQVPPDDVTVVKIDLSPLGGLRISGRPAGAALKVVGPDGFGNEGGLPWEAEGLRSGTYRVEVNREGYLSAVREVLVQPGSTAELAIVLEKKVAGLCSASQPGSWIRLPDMAVPRGFTCAVRVGQQVFVMGGARTDGAQFPPPDGSMEMFDLQTRKWTPRAAMPIPVYGAGCAELDGRIYVFGGRARSGGGSDNSGAAQVYDPSTDRWSTIASMRELRAWLGGAAADGMILAVGGVGYGYRASIEAFTPARGWFPIGSSLPSGRYLLGVGSWRGRVLAIGGDSWEGSANPRFDDILEIDPVKGTTKRVGRLPGAASSISTAFLDDELFLVFDGAIWRLDPAGWRVTELAKVPQGVGGHDSAVVATKEGVLALGGGGGSGPHHREAWFYCKQAP